jgi:hypothetical protein
LNSTAKLFPVATPAGSMSDAERWAQICFLTLKLSRMLRALARTQRRNSALRPRLTWMLRRMSIVSQALYDSGSEWAVTCEPEFTQQPRTKCIPKVAGFETGPPGSRLQGAGFPIVRDGGSPT